MSGSKDNEKPTKKAVKDKFFAFLKSVSLDHGIDRYQVHMGHSYGRNCLLLGWSHTPCQEAVSTIHNFRPNVSEKAIGQALIDSMVKLFHEHNIREDADPEADAPILESILPTLDSTAVEQELDALLDLLESKVVSWTAFVLLEGVKLKGMSELQFGNATIHAKNLGPLPLALEEMETIEVLHRAAVQILEQHANHCQCYLTIDVEGEDLFATQEAILRAQDIVSVLAFYLASMRHRIRSSYQRIGILGQPAITRRQCWLKRTPPIGDSSKSSRYSLSETGPPNLPHEIDQAAVKRWQSHGLDKILQCFQAPKLKPGSAESRIRSAITWYRRAADAYTQDEQFVALTTALESLLIATEDVSITQRLGDTVSTLVGGDFESRERIAKSMRDLYKHRCNIVHAGIPVSQESLFALDDIVSGTIIAFVRKETFCP